MKVGYITLLFAAGASASPFQIYTQPSDLYCLADDESPYLQFSTRTSYQVARNRKPNNQVPNCKPEAAWLLVRHGTRYPEPEVDARFHELIPIATTIIENHERPGHSGQLCKEDLDSFRAWRYRYTPDELEQLAPEGKSDLRILAGAYKLSLPELFENASPEKMAVKYTISKRTRESAEAFLEGLSKTVNWNLSDNNIDDILMVSSGYNALDLNKNCTEWENSRDRPEAKIEKNLFAESPDMKEVIHRVSSRLGFKYDLEFKTVKNMYDLCRSEKAVFYSEPVSTWCAAFTKDDLQILEYYMDLSYYYDSGYGNPMTMKLGCPLVRDMLLKFENITKNNGTGDTVPVTLNFAHSVTLRTAITKLGLARDSMPPKHNNRQAVADRQWRTTRLAPFTGNLAVILYRCTSGEEWKLMFYLNEYQVNYQGCDLGLCNWSYIFDRFKDHINPETCNLDVCNRPSSASNLAVALPFAIALSTLVRLIL
uniref:Multiple inositol polyphosphate phosphatase 1 n=1 Tax=Lygus hesperus TaxID=30085 RepID=A0A0A9XYR9_LYGHE